MKLVSINIEGDKHIDRVLTFFKEAKPDVLCIQEVFLEHFEIFKHTFGYNGVFIPMAYKDSFHEPAHFHNKLFGLAILTRFDIIHSDTNYYIGDPHMVPVFHHSEDLVIFPHTLNHLILGVTFIYEGNSYVIYTTHFPVTPKGLPTQYQTDAVHRVINFLKTKDEFILCGDFNAPRGGEVFTLLATKFLDNVPQEYKTSLDQNLHRVKGLQYMVDGLFSTPIYLCEEVRLVDGISDHMAIVATITRK